MGKGRPTEDELIAKGYMEWCPRGLDVRALREELEEIRDRIRIIERALKSIPAQVDEPVTPER